MAVSTKAILDDVADTLNDKSFKYWSYEDLLDYLNEGLIAISIAKPDASITATEYQLSEGVRQSLPDGTASFQDSDGATLPAATKLVEIILNMGTDGKTPGRAVTITRMDYLSEVNPDWAQASANAQVYHYMYNHLDPKAFWVYPPQPGAQQGYIKLTYNSVPPAVSAYSPSENIPLDDEYAVPLKFFILFKAYSRDTDTANANKSLQYYDAFKVALGIKEQTEIGEDPN